MPRNTRTSFWVGCTIGFIACAVFALALAFAASMAHRLGGVRGASADRVMLREHPAYLELVTASLDNLPYTPSDTGPIRLTMYLGTRAQLVVRDHDDVGAEDFPWRESDIAMTWPPIDYGSEVGTAYWVVLSEGSLELRRPYELLRRAIGTNLMPSNDTPPP